MNCPAFDEEVRVDLAVKALADALADVAEIAHDSKGRDLLPHALEIRWLFTTRPHEILNYIHHAENEHAD